MFGGVRVCIFLLLLFSLCYPPAYLRVLLQPRVTLDAQPGPVRWRWSLKLVSEARGVWQAGAAAGAAAAAAGSPQAGPRRAPFSSIPQAGAAI